uniref:Uncharacterized protein n=1 Tax=Lepeophtheirus salmonis TaxID=72036 RepID=A0A0K2UJC3_LEPSM
MGIKILHDHSRSLEFHDKMNFPKCNQRKKFHTS